MTRRIFCFVTQIISSEPLKTFVMLDVLISLVMLSVEFYSGLTLGSKSVVWRFRPGSVHGLLKTILYLEGRGLCQLSISVVSADRN